MNSLLAAGEHSKRFVVIVVLVLFWVWVGFWFWGFVVVVVVLSVSSACFFLLASLGAHYLACAKFLSFIWRWEMYFVMTNGFF